ncbi:MULTISPECIES: GntR family transcriptional regulator [Bacillus]|uniref:GntR family transcriptional regulator n=1 Tax=Bacillus TaxID=1386 RepID=UPI0003735B43|nr:MULTISPECIES: GntR family transcriptional regulator [Bacillus]
MFIQVNFESDTPIYTQLVHAIMEGVATGSLKAGDELPSVRSLASDLGVNMLTVNKAYQQLKQEQFIQIHRKKGAIINPDGIPNGDSEYYSNLQTTLRPAIVEAICRGLSKEDFIKQTELIFTELKEKGEFHK